MGGERVGFEVPLLPENSNTYVQFQFMDDDDIPYAFVNYTAAYANGRIVKGITDEQGYTQVLYSTNEQEISVHLEV